MKLDIYSLSKLRAHLYVHYVYIIAKGDRALSEGTYPVGATSSRPCHGDSVSPKRTTSPVEGRSFTSRDSPERVAFCKSNAKQKTSAQASQGC